MVDGVINMKVKVLLSIFLLCCGMVAAQTTDPVIMKINGQPVLRSEFEYSYNKNNTEGVIDKKSIDEYVDLFINYKLKVEAAKTAGLDTMHSFRTEFAGYRDQQIRPAMITDADVEAEARRLYRETQQQIDNNGGLVEVSHILLIVPQKATTEQQNLAKHRIDSIYTALRNGADFSELAKKHSLDRGSASQGGKLPPIYKGETLKEFEDQAWALKDGEMSRPFLSPAGWHIILKKGHRNFYSYESQRPAILKFIDQRNLREQIINHKLDTLAKQQHTSPEAILAQKREQMIANDPDLKYLIKEYYDGLLLYEISNQLVWKKAEKDETALNRFFKKNKKRYKWDTPKFKGIAYYTRDAKDIKNVRKSLKRVPFDRWAETLRSTFNADSVLRIRVEKGIFKRGDNALVDAEVFKVDTVVAPMKGYPYKAVYGKKLKAPKEMADVRAQVVADYQDELEKQWVKELRREYAVEIDEAVLKTVNNH